MKNLFLRNPVRALTVIAITMVAPFYGILAHAAIGDEVQRAPDAQIHDLAGVYATIDNIFNILFWGLILVAAIFIILAAFSYLTANGEPEKIKKANHRVIYAAVAVVVGVLARAIPQVICSLLGANCKDADLKA